jgi:hypothetical protein
MDHHRKYGDYPSASLDLHDAGPLVLSLMNGLSQTLNIWWMNEYVIHDSFSTNLKPTLAAACR